MAGPDFSQLARDIVTAATQSGQMLQSATDDAAALAAVATTDEAALTAAIADQTRRYSANNTLSQRLSASQADGNDAQQTSAGLDIANRLG